MKCRYCDSEFKAWQCETCHKEIADVCRPCHAEVVHGDIGPACAEPCDLKQFGGKTDPGWKDDEDAQGYGAIARRAMEDG